MTYVSDSHTTFVDKVRKRGGTGRPFRWSSELEMFGLGERRDIFLLESRKALGFDASKSI